MNMNSKLRRIIASAIAVIIIFSMVFGMVLMGMGFQ